MLPIHNQVQLIGRAGHQPALNHLSDTSLRATLRLYQDGLATASGRSSQVHHLVAWTGVARQLGERVRRGDRLLVQGKLLYRRFVTEGVTHVRAEIHVSHFEVMAGKTHGTAGNTSRREENEDGNE